MSNEQTVQKELKLSELTEEKINELKVHELRKLCQAEELPVTNDLQKMKENLINKKKATAVLDLEKLDEKAIKKLKLAELQEMCRSLGLPAAAKKKDLIKQVLLKKYGRTDKFAQGLTKCRVCSMPVKVKNRTDKRMDNGKTLITRQIQCTGKHRHTYPIKEIV